ncbi:MAG: sulfatase/phosphatase domain-containing protein, partial [Akkermansiaceae bacterium]
GAHREGGHKPEFWNSTGGLRGMKRDMHEAGIRTPMLARWPAVIKGSTSSDHISAFWDILPTMCEIVKQPAPKQSDGISFLSTLKGETKEQKQHDFLYFEFCKGDNQAIFSQAVRKGNWKAYRQKKKGGGMTDLEIYDLANDPSEKKNLAKEKPEIVKTMLAHIKEARTPLPSQKEDVK